jgi:hypothetical protein
LEGFSYFSRQKSRNCGEFAIFKEESQWGSYDVMQIAFIEGIRHFEYDAFSKRQKKPKLTYFYLNKLIESLDHEKPLEGY